jgi:hypothetical protein
VNPPYPWIYLIARIRKGGPPRPLFYLWPIILPVSPHGSYIMQAIRRVFLVSLFFTVSVLVAIWFYPGIENWFSGFNSSVQGGIGSTTYAEIATGALDVGSALLCTSAVFYGAMLIAKRGKAEHPTNAPSAPTASKIAAGDGQRTRLRQRLLLIPVWLIFQYSKNLFSGMSPVGAFEAMTSLESLFFSLVVVAVVVLYANGYQVTYGSAETQKSPSSAGETKK